jgi:DNA-binding GntR family transcriptional regulator
VRQADSAGLPAGPGPAAVDRVYASLRGGILDGSYPQGVRLGEVELAEALGVSRTPVREALRRLGSEGLVETLPNKGARVRTWSPGELDAIEDLRALLEGHAAALAARAVTDSELAVMRRLVEQMEAATGPGVPPDFDLITELNNQFHAGVTAASGNPLLPGVIGQLIHLPIVVRTFRQYSPDRLRESMRQHREILDALASHDAVWAESAMRAHIFSGRAILIPGAPAYSSSASSLAPGTPRPSRARPSGGAS